MFVSLFGIIGPVYFVSQDALLAYRVGLAAAFIGGLIEMSGALILYEEKNENSSENGENLISMGFRRGDGPGCP